MKTLKKSVVLVLISILAKAEQNASMTQYFAEQIVAFQNTNFASGVDLGQQNQFQDINIDLGPTVSFGINSVVQLSITPEIDFVITKVQNQPAP